MNNELKNILISKIIIGLVSGFLLIGLPIFLLDIGISLSEIGFVFGITMFFYAILSFYLGSLSESSGRLWIGTLSIIGMAIASILFGIIPLLSLTIALIVFIIGKILFNLSESILRNIVKIRILDISNHRRLGTGYGLLIFADSLGYGFGILLGGLLLSIVSFQIVFLGLTILLIFSLPFYKKTGDIKIKSEKEKILHISNLVNTSKVFKIVLLINTILLFGAYLVDFFGLPLFQKEILGMTTQQIFILLGSAWLIYGLFSHLGGKLYDKYGLKVFIVSLFMIAVTSVLLAFAKDIILFSSLLILDYIFFSFADPARFALAGFVSRKNKGMLLSFFEFFSILIAAIVMLFFGKLVSLFNFEFIFILRGAIQLVAIFFVMLIYHKIHEK